MELRESSSFNITHIWKAAFTQVWPRRQPTSTILISSYVLIYFSHFVHVFQDQTKAIRTPCNKKRSDRIIF